ncbi:MAG: MtrAB system histidine kinase MtrB [Microbacteriaceae bacterium]
MPENRLERLNLSAWRAWPKRFLRTLRRSLQYRSVFFAGILSLIAVLLISIYMSLSIGSSLFENRLEQALDENARATLGAQQLIYASTASDENALTTLVGQARLTIQERAPGAVGRVAILRTPKQETTTVVQDNLSPSISEGVISPEIRQQVGEAENQQFYQSVSLGTKKVPALVVGSQLDLGPAGKYELYTVFDLSEVQQTLSFVQQTLLVGGAILVLLIVLVSWFIVRMTVAPIQAVAETSSQFAAGNLDARIPVRGEDEISTLARSFNNMAASLKSQITRLAELSTLQQRFVSDVSHELRTPLTTIRLAGDVLYAEREKLPAKTRRSAELLQSQTERFEELLNDLLEISRIDAGAVVLEHDPVSMVKMVEESIEDVREIAEQQGSDIRLVAVGGYLEVDIDSRRIRRIVNNLLGNAIEHGEGKPIVVSIDSNERAVAVSVRDYGIGMKSSEVQQVFERFWRADPSRKRTLGGTGLGLAISQEDAGLHNGWLEVWSEPGAGSCFRLTLPLRSGELIEVSPLPLVPDDYVPAEVPTAAQAQKKKTPGGGRA